MSIRVKLPNGEVGEFPDSMSHEEIESVLQKQFPPTEDQSSIAPTPFNGRPQPIPERTGLSGVGYDLSHGLASALKGTRKFASEVPSNLEKSSQYIEQNPVSSIFHNLGQMASETADIGKGVINAPYNLNQYLARKHLLPQVLGKLGQLIPHIPEDTGVENALGLAADSEKGDAIFRAIPDIASVVAPGISVAKATKKAFAAPDLKSALKQTQATVNKADKSLGKAFDTVESEVEKRGVKPVPIDKDTITQAKRFLDKSPETKEIIEQAAKGDYKALRQIQSDLRVIGEEALANKLSTERKVGKEALSTRNKINSAIENHFESTGHKDLANLLNKTKKGYKEIQDIYFSSPALARVFGKSQKLPKNPLTLLTEDSTEMTRFFNAHPEMKTMLEKALKHGKNKSRIKGVGKIAAGALVGEEFGRFLHK